MNEGRAVKVVSGVDLLDGTIMEELTPGAARVLYTNTDPEAGPVGSIQLLHSAETADGTYHYLDEPDVEDVEGPPLGRAVTVSLGGDPVDGAIMEQINADCVRIALTNTDPEAGPVGSVQTCDYQFS